MNRNAPNGIEKSREIDPIEQTASEEQLAKRMHGTTPSSTVVERSELGLRTSHASEKSV